VRTLTNLRHGPGRPLTGFLVLFALIFLGLSARLFYLQVVRGEYFRDISARNHIRVIMKPAPRGLILDRNGEVLVDNVPSFRVSIVPYEFRQADLEMTAGLLAIDAESLSAVLETASDRPYRPYPVREGMSVADVSALAENLYRIGGIVIDVVPMRRYPCGSEFCHLIGYVGLASAEDSYEGEITGRSGLELTLNGILSGQPGYRREVVDAMGKVVEEFEGGGEEQPVPGESVSLTLDAGLQRIAATALSLESAPGAAVVIDYTTGEILCLASSPVFDMQRIASGISGAAWDSICTDQARPLLSRAWAARYPPGSIFKLVTALYLLQSGAVSPDYRPDPCFGSYRLGDRDFGCWTVHGRLDMVGALARSCDVFFYRTVQLGSLEGLAEFARGFGLGSRMTDILPGECAGLVPDADLLDGLYGEGGWGLGNLLNISIGQGELLVTPLQMACVAGLIASGGNMPGLRLAREIDPRAAPWADLHLSAEAVAVVTEGMRAAVSDPSGTLLALDALPWQFYGKSGTAESASGAHAWVIGFLREPRPLAIAVVVEHGGHGGAVAAPIVSRILLGYLGSPE
jgi:penicillin-binding protein 2